MRYREWPKVEQAEPPPKSSDVHSAIVVSSTASIFIPVAAQFVVALSQLASSTPFGTRHYKSLPERPARPVIRVYG